VEKDLWNFTDSPFLARKGKKKSFRGRGKKRKKNSLTPVNLGDPERNTGKAYLRWRESQKKPGGSEGYGRFCASPARRHPLKKGDGGLNCKKSGIVPREKGNKGDLEIRLEGESRGKKSQSRRASTMGPFIWRMLKAASTKVSYGYLRNYSTQESI